MKKAEVELGHCYIVKVSGKLARVRIERESPFGGWDARNLDTGRPVRIRSAARLRRPAKEPHPERDYTTLAEFFPVGGFRPKNAEATAGSSSTIAAEQATTQSAADGAATTPPEDRPDDEEKACDPDVCATVGCGRPAELMYLGRPRCMECYRDDAGDDDRPEQQAGPAGDLPGPAKAGAKPKRLSALDAAARVLARAGKPMRAQELIAAMAEQGLWTSPGGKTPEATLYAAIIREISDKGKEARFRKVDRGQFAYCGRE